MCCDSLYGNDFMYLDATIYVGGLDEKVTETILWELFLQAGPVGEHHAARAPCALHAWSGS